MVGEQTCAYTSNSSKSLRKEEGRREGGREGGADRQRPSLYTCQEKLSKGTVSTRKGVLLPITRTKLKLLQLQPRLRAANMYKTTKRGE